MAVMIKNAFVYHFSVCSVAVDDVAVKQSFIESVFICMHIEMCLQTILRTKMNANMKWYLIVSERHFVQSEP